MLASCSVGGLYLALGPALARDLMHTDNHLAGGAAMTVLCASGAVAQLGWRAMEARRAASIGAAILAAGMALTIVSISAGSAVLFLVAGGVVAGAGFGLAFLGALRSLTAVVPAHRRAEVMSAFYVVAYLSISVPAIVAGLAVTELGLEPAARIFSSAVALVALSVAVAAWRHRVAAPTLIAHGSS